MAERQAGELTEGTAKRMLLPEPALAVGRQDKDTRLPKLACEESEQRKRRRIRPLKVVQDEQHGPMNRGAREHISNRPVAPELWSRCARRRGTAPPPGGLQRAPDQLADRGSIVNKESMKLSGRKAGEEGAHHFLPAEERRSLLLVHVAALEDQRSRSERFGHEIQKACLADSRLTADGNDSSVSRNGVLPCAAEKAYLGRSPHEHASCGRAARSRHSSGLTIPGGFWVTIQTAPVTGAHDVGYSGWVGRSTFNSQAPQEAVH